MQGEKWKISSCNLCRVLIGRKISKMFCTIHYQVLPVKIFLHIHMYPLMSKPNSSGCSSETDVRYAALHWTKACLSLNMKFVSIKIIHIQVRVILIHSKYVQEIIWICTNVLNKTISRNVCIKRFLDSVLQTNRAYLTFSLHQSCYLSSFPVWDKLLHVLMNVLASLFHEISVLHSSHVFSL